MDNTDPNKTIIAWKAGKSGRVEGAREKVKDEISKLTIPAHAQTFLIGEIEARPAHHNWITLDAHYTGTKSDGTLHHHISSSEENL